VTLFTAEQSSLFHSHITKTWTWNRRAVNILRAVEIKCQDKPKCKYTDYIIAQ